MRPRCFPGGGFYALLALCALVPAVAAAEGVLTVKTDPEGIEVWLGDKFLGQSPIIEKKIKAGRYILKLVDPVQHSSTNEEVLIQEGEAAVVERAITSKFGRLKVMSVPEGADVSIATELGKTPLTNDFMNPGRYRIEIRPSGSRFLHSVLEVDVLRGETTLVEEKLKKRSFLSKKNIASLALFAGTAGGFVWGLVEQGNYKMYKERRQTSRMSSAAAKRVSGIIIGSACAVGLEIIALF